MDLLFLLIASIPIFIVFMFGVLLWLYILPNSWTGAYTTADKFKYAAIIAAPLAVILKAIENKGILFY